MHRRREGDDTKSEPHFSNYASVLVPRAFHVSWNHMTRIKWKSLIGDDSYRVTFVF